MRHLPFSLQPPFEMPTVFLGRCAAGSFRHVHLQSTWFGRYAHSSPAWSLPLLQRTVVSKTLGRPEQTSEAGFPKGCFHSLSEHVTLSFLIP